jgi:hypothetical protein
MMGPSRSTEEERIFTINKTTNGEEVLEVAKMRNFAREKTRK